MGSGLSGIERDTKISAQNSKLSLNVELGTGGVGMAAMGVVTSLVEVVGVPFTDSGCREGRGFCGCSLALGGRLGGFVGSTFLSDGGNGGFVGSAFLTGGALVLGG